MALSAGVQWDVRTTGSDSNGGGFDPSVSGFATDGAATTANTASPLFSSASYTFVAGDVGAWVFIKSGTNWTPGFYKIASVAGGNATLDAAVGHAQLYSASSLGAGDITASLNIVAGCATTGSPTSATWGVDYSQQDAAQVAYTDLVIGGTTTQLTSAGNPFSYALVGNTLNVTGGTGFTTGRYTMASFTVAGAIATMDRSVGTGASTGGTGNNGGSLLTIATSWAAMAVAGNVVWLKAGTYTLTSTIGGTVNTGSIFTTTEGYNSVHGDLGTRPLITTSTSSTDLFHVAFGNWTFSNLSLSNTASSRSMGIRIASQNVNSLYVYGCLFDGFTDAIDADNGSSTWEVTGLLALVNSEIKNSTGDGIRTASGVNLIHSSYIHNNGNHGITDVSSAYIVAVDSVFYANGSDGINAGSLLINSVFMNNTRDGANNAGSTFGVVNCVFYGNGRYGLNTSGCSIDMNNAYKNTSDRNGVRIGLNDITLTGDPFTNSSGGDFTLNNTAGAGALLRSKGFPGISPMGTGYLDVGVLQHSYSGGGGLVVPLGMLGGIRG